jgi:hypothetical protein
MSINIINLQVPVMEMQCVSCEVGTELLYIIYMRFMRQSVNNDKLHLNRRIKYE